MERLEQQIHQVLFPKIPFKYESYCKEYAGHVQGMAIDRRWRRAKCDVQAMWCHIHYQNDIFVTEDRNFLKRTKKPQLIALGAKEILLPSLCLAKLTTKRNSA
jgi:hypothetical protein